MAIVPINLPLPEPGSWQEIDSDLLWLRMPLPFELDHINLYLIRDGEGFALIDTGLGTEKTKVLWLEIFEKLQAPLTKVIVTHMHPDHIGMAGWVTEHFQIPLYMSSSEYFVGRTMFAGAQGASQWVDERFYVQCGLGDDYIHKALANRKGMSAVVKPIPLSFERLSEGDSLVIGSTNWRVIVGRGHSPEHVCLYNEENGWLISGDHVLPKISPNIGVYSTEPNANSLARYLSTLPQFFDLPEDTLVLPSHKEPITGLHQRVHELISHHHQHLHNLKAFCKEPKTVIDCLPVLFKRELNQHNMFFAVAECLSHLNYLVFSRQLERQESEQGIYQYTSTTETLDLALMADARMGEEQPLQT